MIEKQIGLFSALLDAGVEFAVVGGVAVNVHGFTRSTLDIDIFIRPTPSNAEAAYRALEAAGVPTSGFAPNDLLDDETHFRFHSGGMFVDILASIGEISFDEVWSDRLDVPIGGLMVPFISKASLLLNKRQTGRLRHLLDVEELELVPEP